MLPQFVLTNKNIELNPIPKSIPIYLKKFDKE